MNTKYTSPYGSTEFECAVCGNGHVVSESEGNVVCPNCNESYSLICHDGFTMIEKDGWVTRIAVGSVDDSLPRVANG